MADTITTKTITWGTGRNVIWAGTPVDTNGKVANDSTAIGIVTEDLHLPDRALSVLTAGEWDETLPEHQKSGIVLSDAAKKAMSDITFTVAPVTLIDATALDTILEGYVETSDLTDYVKTEDLVDYAKTEDLPVAATTTDAGIVLQAEAVTDAADAPTMAEFNGLLDALRDAGIMAEPVTPEENT